MKCFICSEDAGEH